MHVVLGCVDIFSYMFFTGELAGAIVTLLVGVFLSSIQEMLFAGVFNHIMFFLISRLWETLL